MLRLAIYPYWTLRKICAVWSSNLKLQPVRKQLYMLSCNFFLCPRVRPHQGFCSISRCWNFNLCRKHSNWNLPWENHFKNLQKDNSISPLGKKFQKYYLENDRLVIGDVHFQEGLESRGTNQISVSWKARHWSICRNLLSSHNDWSCSFKCMSSIYWWILKFL